jgi:hypothetical protein
LQAWYFVGIVYPGCSEVSMLRTWIKLSLAIGAILPVAAAAWVGLALIGF